MSAFGVPPEISALQTVQAQREAAKLRDRTRAAIERPRSAAEAEERFRVHDTAQIAKARNLEEESEGEEERSRRRRQQHDPRGSGVADRTGPDDQGHIDITA